MTQRTRTFFALLLTVLLPMQALALTPNDPRYSDQGYLQQIGAEEAWSEVTGSRDVIVAVIDSGIDLTHPDLVDNIFRNTREVAGDGVDNDGNGYVDDTVGWDFFDNDANPNPENLGDNQAVGLHHGTVVAGLIGAAGNNGKGITGVNWEVSILPLRALNTEGDGSFDSIVAAIDYAVAMEADVINLSFVGDLSSTDLQQSLQRAYDSGAVVVAALGNSNGGQDVNVDPVYPACVRGDGAADIVIGVTAVTDRDRWADFSNYGSGCADIAAPGDGLLSTQVSGTIALYGDGWRGTSLSAPLVAGAAALMRAKYPSVTPEQVMTAIELSADPIVGSLPKGQSGSLGAGRLHIGQALIELASMMPDPSTAQPLVLGAGPGDAPWVVVINPDGTVAASWLAYTEGFKGGVQVGIGQLDQDPELEVATAPGIGGGPHVRVFDLDGTPVDEFFAFEKDFRGGVQIAVGDVDSLDIDEIIAAPGPGRDPVVRFFRPTGALMNEVELEIPEGPTIYVSMGDLDHDDAEDVVVSTGEGGDSRVYVYRIYGSQQTSFETYPGTAGPVHTSVWEGIAEKPYVLSRTAPSADPYVRSFNYIGAFVGQFDAAIPIGDAGDVTVWQTGETAEPLLVTSEMQNGSPVLRARDFFGNVVDLAIMTGGFFTKSIQLSH